MGKSQEKSKCDGHTDVLRAVRKKTNNGLNSRTILEDVATNQNFPSHKLRALLHFSHISFEKKKHMKANSECKIGGNVNMTPVTFLSVTWLIVVET